MHVPNNDNDISLHMLLNDHREQNEKLEFCLTFQINKKKHFSKSIIRLYRIDSSKIATTYIKSMCKTENDNNGIFINLLNDILIFRKLN